MNPIRTISSIDYIEEYESIPVLLSAAKITEENINELAVWCGGDVRPTQSGSRYLVVPSVSPEEVQGGSAGMILAREDKTGKFRIYNQEDFELEFRPASGHIELEDSEVEKDSSLYPDPDEMTVEVEEPVVLGEFSTDSAESEDE